MVRGLESDGLASRTRDTVDRRKVWIQLTPEGPAIQRTPVDVA